MAIMHTPETAGAIALYRRDDTFGDFKRNVLGWDKQGHPLVLCGGQLYAAATAPFAHHPKFIEVKRPDAMTEVITTITDTVTEIIAGELRDMFWNAEHIDTLVSNAIRDVVRERLTPKDNT